MLQWKILIVFTVDIGKHNKRAIVGFAYLGVKQDLERIQNESAVISLGISKGSVILSSGEFVIPKDTEVS